MAYRVRGSARAAVGSVYLYVAACLYVKGKPGWGTQAMRSVIVIFITRVEAAFLAGSTKRCACG